MKFLTCIITILCLASCADPVVENTGNFKTEQLYKGHSKSGHYLCYLKISSDNQVLFTYETEGNYTYGEHSGTIKAINDTLFRVNCELTFGQFVCKAFDLDSLVILVDPSVSLDKKMLFVQYDNEELMKRQRIDKSGVAFTFDPNLFNEYTPARILTDHIHPVTKQPLTLKASFGSAYDFVRGGKVEFDVVISGDSMYSVGDDVAFQPGPIHLKRQ